MSESLEQMVRRRALGRCEYCLFPEQATRLKHVLDHIIARQHGGVTDAENLSLCCGRCNRFKGPNLAGVDSDSGQIVRLFHPRRDIWVEHFRYDGSFLSGITPIGRVTVAVLVINLPIRVAARQALIESGFLI